MVLSLLFLFVLIAITYVLVATRQLSASRQFAKSGSLTGDPPPVQLNKALMQVLRGDAGIVDTTGTNRGKISFRDRPAQFAGKHVRAVFDSGSIDQLPPAEETPACPMSPAGRSWNSRPPLNPAIATPVVQSLSPRMLPSTQRSEPTESRWLPRRLRDHHDQRRRQRAEFAHRAVRSGHSSCCGS